MDLKFTAEEGSLMFASTTMQIGDALSTLF
jgi:hypothetical protein